MAGLPVKTTADDIDNLLKYLRTQIGWTLTEKIGKATNPRLVDGRKLEAMKFIGLIERNSSEIKLTDNGRAYVEAKTPEEKAKVIADRLREVAIYEATLEWIAYNKRESSNKTDIANYWHNNHSTATGGAKGDGLTDAVIFFMRMADAAALGKFVPAGKGRDSHLKASLAALEAFVAGGGGDNDEEDEPGAAEDEAPNPNDEVKKQKPTPKGTPTIADRIHVNIEIHIAADAKASTVEEIFKNMRKYLLDNPGEDD